MAARLVRLFLLLVASLLTSCETLTVQDIEERDLQPAWCRAFGVEVADDDVKTGRVVEVRGWSFAAVEKVCFDKPPVSVDDTPMVVGGCARDPVLLTFPSLKHEYLIAAADICHAWHEACHAVFEEATHTVPFLVRQFQGDRLAACPPGEYWEP